MSEVDRVRDAYLHDPSMTNEDYGRLMEVAALADRARELEAEKPEPDHRFWIMPDRDPSGRPWGIVDESCGGIIAYGADEACAEFIEAALNHLDAEGLIEVQDYISTSDGRIIR